MATNKSAEKKGTTMDVSSKAAKSSPTSRPIIVGHGPVMKDPMVQEGSSEEKAKEIVQVKAPSSREKTLAVPAEFKEEQSSAKNEELKSKESGDPDSNKDQTGSDNSEQSIVAQSANKAIKKQDEVKEQKVAAEKLAQNKEKIKKLIEEKKYFVKISDPKRKTKRLLLMFIAIIMLLTFTLVALDAELVKLGLELPFDLLGSSKTIDLFQYSSSP